MNNASVELKFEFRKNNGFQIILESKYVNMFLFIKCYALYSILAAWKRIMNRINSLKCFTSLYGFQFDGNKIESNENPTSEYISVFLIVLVLDSSQSPNWDSFIS